MRFAFALVTLVGTTTSASAEHVRLHAEVDPLPIVLGGYGAQVGARYRNVRVSVASFSLDVPDAIAELGGNDGFHLHVRPSPALYVLYYYKDRFAVGGSLRYLRMRYSHDAVAGTAEVSELSPEEIVGYMWHPTRSGFYLQPWLGLSSTAWRSDEPDVGDRHYDQLPVQVFFTVNLGWELVL
jgi:hypothetical protein